MVHLKENAAKLALRIRIS